MSEFAIAAGAAPDRETNFLTDYRTMAGRCIRLSRRQLDAILMSLTLPIMLMLMFVYLFGGAIDTGGKYVTYVVPGVILLCAGFGSATTAVSVSQDMTGGIVDRFRSMDVSGAAVLGGHVAASLARNTVSTVMVFGVAFGIGFRPHAGLLDWLGAAGVVLLFILAISWLAATIGLLAKSAEAANGFTFFLMFLPYASSAFVSSRWPRRGCCSPAVPPEPTSWFILVAQRGAAGEAGRSPALTRNRRSGASAIWSGRVGTPTVPRGSIDTVVVCGAEPG
jgi:ABC-2 type transport system permease protein